MHWIFGNKTANEKTIEARQGDQTNNSSPQPNKDMELWYLRQMERWHTGKNLCDANQMERWRKGMDPNDANQIVHTPCDAKQLALWNATYMELFRTRQDLWNQLPAKFRLNFIPY